VRTAHEISGRKRVKGEVAEAGPDVVALTGTAGPIEIPYTEIVRGNLMDGGSRNE
jgi:hypothetical protein